MNTNEVLNKLIAEVERLKPRLRKIGGKDFTMTTSEVYKRLERIIEFARALQQEQPLLPSNLDEAADKATGEYVYNEGGPFSGTTGVSFLAGFKAGAEWMAEQGGTIECSIDWYDGPIPDCSEEQLFSAIEKAELEVGDKVIIQIRKK